MYIYKGWCSGGGDKGNCLGAASPKLPTKKTYRIHTYIHTYIHFLFYNAGLMFGNLLLVDVDLQLKSSKQKENLIQNPI